MPVRLNFKKPYENNLAKFVIREKLVTAENRIRRGLDALDLVKRNPSENAAGTVGNMLDRSDPLEVAPRRSIKLEIWLNRLAHLG